jgi:hypothetical protein
MGRHPAASPERRNWRRNRPAGALFSARIAKNPQIVDAPGRADL